MSDYIPANEYHSIKKLSPSVICKAFRGETLSMRRLWAELNRPYVQTKKKHLKIGTAVHTLFMEPERFESEIHFHDGFKLPDLEPKERPAAFNEDDVKIGHLKDPDKIKKKISDARLKHADSIVEHDRLERQKLEMRDKTVLLESWRSEVEEIVEVAKQNKELVSMFADANIEQSFEVELFGVPFKCRPDCWKQVDSGYFVLNDLKTSFNAEDKAFGRTASNMFYNVKMACYRNVIELATGLQCGGVNLGVIETTWPYDSAVYEMDENDLDQGWERAERVIKKFAECRANNHWTGLAERGVQPLHKPNWDMPESLVDFDELNEISKFESEVA